MVNVSGRKGDIRYGATAFRFIELRPMDLAIHKFGQFLRIEAALARSAEDNTYTVLRCLIVPLSEMHVNTRHCQAPKSENIVHCRYI